MRASSLVLAALVSVFAALTGSHTIATSSPASIATSTAPIVDSDPATLQIPAIGLDTPIVGVGVDSTGAMAVPSPKTNDVGWYEYGTRPGDVGSAVIDAHVFAAFSNLDQVQEGDSVYVVDQSGQTLQFVVTAVKDYALATLSSLQLFTPTSERDLNLITCAGNLTPDHSTYDHRLIVYTTLVG